MCPQDSIVSEVSQPFPHPASIHLAFVPPLVPCFCAVAFIRAPFTIHRSSSLGISVRSLPEYTGAHLYGTLYRSLLCSLTLYSLQEGEICHSMLSPFEEIFLDLMEGLLYDEP
jgi:hypothetical protein